VSPFKEVACISTTWNVFRVFAYVECNYNIEVTENKVILYFSPENVLCAIS
jgi:hypothetical protein